jgi:hypothetical protein
VTHKTGVQRWANSSRSRCSRNFLLFAFAGEQNFQIVRVRTKNFCSPISDVEIRRVFHCQWQRLYLSEGRSRSEMGEQFAFVFALFAFVFALFAQFFAVRVRVRRRTKFSNCSRSHQKFLFAHLCWSLKLNDISL